MRGAQTKSKRVYLNIEYIYLHVLIGSLIHLPRKEKSRVKTTVITNFLPFISVVHFPFLRP